MALYVAVGVSDLAGAGFGGGAVYQPGLHAVLWGAQQALPQLKVEQAQAHCFRVLLCKGRLCG